MTREQIERAAKEAVRRHFQCNGKYPCEERDYCEFCNGNNSAFDCKEDCGADDFNEGFIAGAQWRINSMWDYSGKSPDGESPILIDLGEENGAGRYRLGMTASDLVGAVCWAYVTDLLPGITRLSGPYRGIGEVFEVDGVKLRVAPDNSTDCSGCFFKDNKLGMKCRDYNDVLCDCSDGYANGRGSVIFKEVTEREEETE